MKAFVPLVLYAIVFALIMIINFHFPNLVFAAPYINWLSAAACLLMLLSNKNKNLIVEFPPQLKRVKAITSRMRGLIAMGGFIRGTEKNAASNRPFYKILGVQSLLIITYLTSIILFYKFSFPSASSRTFVADISRLADKMCFSYAAFPWTLYAILTLAFADRFYNQRDIVSLSRVIRPLVPHKKIGIVSIAAHVYFRTVMLFGLGFIISLFAIYIAQYVLQGMGLPLLQGVNFKTFLLMSLFTLPLSNPWGPQLIKALFKNFNFGSILLILLLFMSAIMVFANMFFAEANDFFAQNPLLSQTFSPHLIAHSSALHNLILFSVCWWVAFALPYCWYAARLSAGCSMLQVLSTQLILPFSLIFLLLIPAVANGFLQFIVFASATPRILLGCILLNTAFLCMFFSYKRNIFGICSTSKKRISYNATRNFAHNSAFILSIFLMLHFNMLYYLSVVLTVMCLLYLFTCVLSFMKHLYFE